MKHLPNIAGGLLGAAFIVFGFLFLLNLMPDQPKPPEGSFAALFMGAFVPSGYLAFVKVLEILGGIFVLLPGMRNFGLLVLGPIIVNILAFHLFIMKGVGLFSPLLLILVVLALYLLWDGRKRFLGLLN